MQARADPACGVGVVGTMITSPLLFLVQSEYSFNYLRSAKLRCCGLQGEGGATGGLPRAQGGGSADPRDCAGRGQHPLHHTAAAPVMPLQQALDGWVP